MLLTITTTHTPATDLGYLLYKHPERAQTFELSFGAAHVFYPEASEERCTVALLLDIDPVGLVRGRKDTGLRQYVNDRPYVASSYLSVAISEVLGTAMSGRCKDRPELAQTAIPLEVCIAMVAVRRGSDDLVRRLFEPLGYAVEIERHPLDPAFPDWGESRYFTVTLSGEVRLTDLLSHLYVLIPVLDGDKHYFVGEDEVDKLMRHGEGWLASHPERALISRRYLHRFRVLVDDALERLMSLDEEVASEEDDVEENDGAENDGEETGESGADVVDAVEVQPKAKNLNQRRLETVAELLARGGATRVLDLGCGEGKLLRLLLRNPQFEQIVGMDVAHRALEIAAKRLKLAEMHEARRARIKLLHGSLLYRDRRLEGFDAAAVVEVIEHLDPPRLSAFERALFEFARPKQVVLTTPNGDYNALYDSLPAGEFRHDDHRFEWSRAEFRAWADAVGERHGYQVDYFGVGDADREHGTPTQGAIFERGGS